ncbi:ROK family transcriptional regulator [Nocardioides nanhaiensis]
MQSRVLCALRDHGPQSRPELGAQMGVSRTTVGVEVGRLVTLGLVREQAIGGGPPGAGRRSTVVDLSPDIRFVGVAVGVTEMAVAVTDGHLAVLEEWHGPCELAQGPDVVLAEVVTRARALLAASGAEVPWGLGIGLPGPIDFAAGAPVAPPLMPGWDGHPVREQLARALGCPVVLDNDVNLMAVGELHACSGAGGDLLFVKMGSGIGCGVVVAGRLHRGSNGCAGDIGHVEVVAGDGRRCACGSTDCLEAHAGGAALLREATAAAERGDSAWLAQRLATRREAGAEDLELGDLGEALAAGDRVTATLLREGGRRVGHVLAGLVSFLNPAVIVVGGRVSGLGHVLLAEIRSATYRRSLPQATRDLRIVLSELPEQGGVVGAAHLVSDVVLAPATGVGDTPPHL